MRRKTFSGLPLEVDRFLYAISIAPSLSRVDKNRLALRLVIIIQMPELSLRHLCYSTVTDFARLRGLSTSSPLATLT